MQKVISLLLISMITFFFTYGQIPTDKGLEKSVDSLLLLYFKPTTPGCAVLIAKKGNIVYKKAFGSANLELDVPMRTDMIFRLGSVTKQYTAVAILQLMEQGRISLNDSIQKFIKQFHYKGHTITIENLLTHTSGIMDYENLEVNIPNSWRLDFSPKLIADSLANRPLEFTPGSKYSYSNSNYFLLGYIIELISGETYQDYIRQNIFIPSGLTRTYYDDQKEIIPGRVYGYHLNDSAKYENAEYIGMSQTYSAGALMSDVGDLYKWHQALYSGKLLHKETLDKAFTAHKLSNGSSTYYGYGWFVNPTDKIKSIEHGGRIEGFRSNEMYLPGEDIFIATLFNIEDDRTQLLANDIAILAIGKPLQKQITVNGNLQDNYIGTYQMVADPKRTLVIGKEFEQLFVQLSKTTTVPLIAQSENKFMMQGVKPAATIEFVKEHDEIVKLIISQNGLFEWKKIK